MRPIRLVALVRNNWPYAGVRHASLAVRCPLLAGLAILSASSAIAQERVETVERPPPSLAADAPVHFERPATLDYGRWPGTFVHGTVAWTVGSNPAIATAVARFPNLDFAITVAMTAPVGEPLVIDVTWTGEPPNPIAGLRDVTVEPGHLYGLRAFTLLAESVGNAHYRLTDPDGLSRFDEFQLLGIVKLHLYLNEVGGQASRPIARTRITLEGARNAEPASVFLEDLGPLEVLPPLAAILIAIGFAFWRVALGRSYARIGWRPLAFGYALFFGLMFANLATLGGGFSGLNRIADFLLYALAAASFILTPIAAQLVLAGHGDYRAVKAFVAFDIAVTVYFAWATFLVFVISPWTSTFIYGVLRSVRRQEDRERGRAEPAGPSPP